MNPRCPTDTLMAGEIVRLRDLIATRGEHDAVRAVGMRDPGVVYKAAAGFPVSRLTAEVIRGRLDRI